MARRNANKRPKVTGFYAKKRGQSTYFFAVCKATRRYLGWELIGEDRKDVGKILRHCMNELRSNSRLGCTIRDEFDTLRVFSGTYSKAQYKVTHVIN